MNDVAKEHADGASASSVRLEAVIDIGATGVRMAIAQIGEGGEVHTLERLHREVGLGQETFANGRLSKGRIEECARILTQYRKVLEEYGIDQPERIHALATSAVREASNRDAFIDRVYIATGILVHVADEAEINRHTYMAVLPHLENDPSLKKTHSLIIEVGGGSTTLLLARKTDIIYSQNFRLGTVRLRKMQMDLQAAPAQFRRLIKSEIQRSVSQMLQSVPLEESANLIIIGGDIRFAAYQLLPNWDPNRLGRLPVKRLDALADALLALTPDELVQRYHLTYPDAESIGPALLAYCELARAFHVRQLLVAQATMRDGWVQELAAGGAWTNAFEQQIIRSALDLGRKYHFDEGHAVHVAELCRRLFDELAPLHQLGPRYGLILRLGAILSEIGFFISNRSHHKHSLYLILHSELFGLGEADKKLVALVARYHRRAPPRPAHLVYSELDRDQRIAVAKMAAILRVADALDRAHRGRVRDFRCRIEDERIILTLQGLRDLSLEELALQDKGSLFQDVYGRSVVLRKGRRTAASQTGSTP